MTDQHPHKKNHSSIHFIKFLVEQYRSFKQWTYLTSLPTDMVEIFVKQLAGRRRKL